VTAILDADVQLHQPRLADVVAGILRTRIIDGVIPNGSRLPKQDELLREFRVSRPSLREALRILEAEGLVTVQRGNVGGAIVRAPSAQSAAYMSALVLQSQGVTLKDLADAIRNVEPVAAAMCAARKDRRRLVVPQLKRIQKASRAAIGDGVLFTQTAREFHEEFVRGCGNSTLIMMLGMLELMWSHQEAQWAERAQARGTYPGPEAREDVLAAHEAVLRAIDSGDEDQAARAARVHINETQRYPLAEERDTVIQAPASRGLLSP
jgi:GntR family transcriptional regulator, transcriptional repressor for pyruvate dehydrogenase complex